MLLSAPTTRSCLSASTRVVGPQRLFSAPRRVQSCSFRPHVLAVAANKLSGRVKWFDSKKGYGFIAPDDGSPDLFVHQSSIIKDGYRSLADGEPVEYVVENSSDGRTRAVQVTGPDGSQPQGAPPAPAGRRESFGGGSYGGGYGGGGRGSYGGRSDYGGPSSDNFDDDF